MGHGAEQQKPESADAQHQASGELLRALNDSSGEYPWGECNQSASSCLTDCTTARMIAQHDVWWVQGMQLHGDAVLAYGSVDGRDSSNDLDHVVRSLFCARRRSAGESKDESPQKIGFHVLPSVKQLPFVVPPPPARK